MKIEMSQEEVDRLSTFIEEHTKNEPNPFARKGVRDIYDRLPDSANSKMKKEN